MGKVGAGNSWLFTPATTNLMTTTDPLGNIGSFVQRRGVQRRDVRRSSLLVVTSLAMSAVSLPAIAQVSGGTADRAFAGEAPPKVVRYAAALLRQYDQDGNGQLDKEEWQQMSGQPSAIDRDHDGVVTLSEFQTHILAYGRARAPVSVVRPVDVSSGGTEPTVGDSVSVEGERGSESGDVTTESGGGTKTEVRQRNTKFFVRPSRGLGKMPSWFLARDADGDGQLTLREFSADSPGRSREFEKIDRNGDGVLTPREATTPRDGKQPSNP